MTDDERGHFDKGRRVKEPASFHVWGIKTIIPPTTTDLTLSYIYQGEITTITIDRAAVDIDPGRDFVDITIRGFFPGFTITIEPSKNAQ